MSDTPTYNITLLEAVNQVLRAAGLAPVTGLGSANMNVDAEGALNALEDASRTFQARAGGWEFNREFRTLPAEGNGSVLLPSDCISVRTAGEDRWRTFVKRGGKLYDRDNGTFNIGKSVKVQLVVYVEWDDLPQGARTAVIGAALKDWSYAKNPTPALGRKADDMVRAGMTLAEQEDAEQADTTLPSANPQFHWRR
jgi:hypothetical protein